LQEEEPSEPSAGGLLEFAVLFFCIALHKKSDATAFTTYAQHPGLEQEVDGVEVIPAASCSPKDPAGPDN
jgi:hypothetical protein